MPIDVTCEITIDCPRQTVARFVEDSANDPRWIAGITEARVLTSGPFGAGTRVTRIAKFMRRTITYVLEVAEYRPAELVAMRSVEGPFPMDVTYSFATEGAGTRVAIRNEGGPGGPMRLLSPITARMVRRNVGRDLARLKAIVEGGADG